MNYKIKVDTQEQNKRAQIAFFALDCKWHESRWWRIDQLQELHETRANYLFVEDRIIQAGGKGAFDCDPAEEITLEALEQKAADHMLANLPEMQYYQPSDYEVATIAESPNEGQKRYEAAIEWLQNNADKLYDPNTNKNSICIEDNSAVQQALKIAAGIS